MSGVVKTLLLAFAIAFAGALTTVISWAGLQYGDTRWVTVASTERALLREYRLGEIDLEYLEKKGIITERQQLKLDQLRVDIEELEQEFK
jgi:hypothetical protein